MTQIEDFDILNLIALGSYGQVFRVRKKQGQDNSKIYAMKVVNKTGNVMDQFILHERKILEVARHSFIVELMYAFQTTTKFYLVLEFCWGDLITLMKCKNKIITEKFFSFHMKETIMAIQHLHDNQIVHRDIKPHNILIDMKGHVKLCDFSASVILDKGQSINNLCGTFGYIAPEILSDESYGKAVDWFSLGVVFYEMLMKRPLFLEESRYELLKSIQDEEKYLEPLNLCLSKAASDLISRFLRVNPSERLGFSGVKEIQDHSFFKKTKWDRVVDKFETPPFVPPWVEEKCRKKITIGNFFENEVDEKPKPFYQDFDYHSSNLNKAEPFEIKSIQKIYILEENKEAFYDRSVEIDSNCICNIL